MKKYLIVLTTIILTSIPDEIFLFGKQVDTKPNYSDLNTDFQDKGNNKIVGKWYSSYLNFEENELVFYKSKKSLKQGVLYELTFSANGDLKIKDLTDDYSCAMGILNLDEGQWKIHHKEHLILEVSGEFTSDYSFEKKLEYFILSADENQLKLRLDYVLMSCYWNYDDGTTYID